MIREYPFIDDDGHALRLIEFALTKAGHEVITASRGKEGLQKAFQQPPDLAIVDLMMPQMDGYEVCRRLRQNERTALSPSQPSHYNIQYFALQRRAVEEQ